MKKLLNLKIAFISIISLLLFITAFNVSAQIVEESDVLISLSPTYPKVGDNVTLTLSSFTVNLDKAFIIWSVDGEDKASGIGKKVFSFDLDNLGSQTQISASIDLVDGTSIAKNISINSSDIDLLWEAVDSYVPPFYRGKAMVTREGSFKVVAIPAVSTASGPINPNNLTYTWKKDTKGQPSASGFGKSSLTFKNSYLSRTNEIEVKVTDIENKLSTGGKITLAGLLTPKVVFYSKDLIAGIKMEKALSNGYKVPETGDTIVAVPYFITPKNLNSRDVVFAWRAGGKPVSSPKVKNQITVVGPEGEDGSTSISVSVENVKMLFGEVTKEINVAF